MTPTEKAAFDAMREALEYHIEQTRPIQGGINALAAAKEVQPTGDHKSFLSFMGLPESFFDKLGKEVQQDEITPEIHRKLNEFVAQQAPMPADFAKLLADNLWDLYAHCKPASDPPKIGCVGHDCAECRAREAQPQPARRPDGTPTSKVERYLRRLLGARSGIRGLYTDDGEMQGEEGGINIDFMRDSVEEIEHKLLDLGRARLNAQQAQPQPPEILATYQGKSGRRQHHTANAWLYPGDAIAVIQQAQPQPMNPWQQAIDDEMVALHLGGAWGNPKACLKELLDWHVSVALDPSVSSDAAALVDRGRAEAKKLEQTCKDFEDALLDAMQTLAWLQFGECRGYSAGLLTAREAIEKGAQVLVKHRGNCETI